VLCGFHRMSFELCSCSVLILTESPSTLFLGSRARPSRLRYAQSSFAFRLVCDVTFSSLLASLDRPTVRVERTCLADLSSSGPSALAGIAFFLLIIPVQAWSMQKSIKIRAESMQYTDQRAKILQELLGAMRVIK
jgi:hypothetical protein